MNPAFEEHFNAPILISNKNPTKRDVIGLYLQQLNKKNKKEKNRVSKAKITVCKQLEKFWTEKLEHQTIPLQNIKRKLDKLINEFELIKKILKKKSEAQKKRIANFIEKAKCELFDITKSKTPSRKAEFIETNLDDTTDIEDDSSEEWNPPPSPTPMPKKSKSIK